MTGLPALVWAISSTALLLAATCYLRRWRNGHRDLSVGDLLTIYLALGGPKRRAEMSEGLSRGDLEELRRMDRMIRDYRGGPSSPEDQMVIAMARSVLCRRHLKRACLLLPLVWAAAAASFVLPKLAPGPVWPGMAAAAVGAMPALVVWLLATRGRGGRRFWLGGPWLAYEAVALAALVFLAGQIIWAAAGTLGR
jgi:hypothetical protein